MGLFKSHSAEDWLSLEDQHIDELLETLKRMENFRTASSLIADMQQILTKLKKDKSREFAEYAHARAKRLDEELELIESEISKFHRKKEELDETEEQKKHLIRINCRCGGNEGHHFADGRHPFNIGRNNFHFLPKDISNEHFQIHRLNAEFLRITFIGRYPCSIPHIKEFKEQYTEAQIIMGVEYTVISQGGELFTFKIMPLG